jgi:hypothetical protein
VLAALSLATCAQTDGRTRTCDFPREEPRRLDLTRSVDQAHLRDDAESAETIAIHYADVSPSRRQGRDEYRKERDACLASLFSAVARNHAVDVAIVREYATGRSRGFDAAVLIAFGVGYGLAVYTLSGVIIRRFAPDGGRATMVAAIPLSIGVAVAGLMLFGMWAGTAESLRLGSWHLSYRGERLPWRQHRVWLFMGAVGLFWLASLLRYRRATEHGSPTG